MHFNVGGIDQALRILLGTLLIGAGFLFQNWWGAIGAIPFLTGVAGFCPLYSIMGISTRRRRLAA